MRSKQYRYTVSDVAWLARVGDGAVYYAVKTGALDMEDMESVYRWIVSKRPLFGRQSETATKEPKALTTGDK